MRDGFRRNRLVVARDTYGCHYDELPEDRRQYVQELIALALIERDEMKPADGPDVDKLLGGKAPEAEQ